jgi:hypothetical protein
MMFGDQRKGLRALWERESGVLSASAAAPPLTRAKPRRAEQPPVTIRLLEAMPRHPLHHFWRPRKNGVTPLRSLKRDFGDILKTLSIKGFFQ